MNYFNYSRREATEVYVGATPMGGTNPIRIQSMTNTPTVDTDACVAQAIRIIDAGGEYVRLTTQGVREAENLKNINIGLRSQGYNTPLIADVHFNPKVADVAALYAEGVRINPGNYVDAARTFKKLEYTDEEYAKEILALGINTVDSFDIHTQITSLRRSLNETATAHGAVSIISAGWDPGSDSIVRTLLQAIAPKGITYTNFGPGMSMGHTVAVKAIEGVQAALSMTIPTGEGIHRRMVYIEVKPGYDFEKVAAAIKADAYFVNDETHVIEVPCVDDVIDMGHGVHLTRKGVSGKTQNQLFSFDMKINNPALTGQVLVCSARAAMRQKPGCYTLVEVPVIDLLPGEREELIGHLV